jgi:hypothetical protein
MTRRDVNNYLSRLSQQHHRESQYVQKVLSGLIIEFIGDC